MVAIAGLTELERALLEVEKLRFVHSLFFNIDNELDETYKFIIILPTVYVMISYSAYYKIIY